MQKNQAVSFTDLKSLFEEKTLAFESAINTEKPHIEINRLYQELKLIQQELNLANLKEELKRMC